MKLPSITRSMGPDIRCSEPDHRALAAIERPRGPFVEHYALGHTTRMERISTLPGGCKSLSDIVRVIDLNGVQLPLMTLIEAQTLASDHHAELVHIATGRERIFRLVDDALRTTLRKP